MARNALVQQPVSFSLSLSMKYAPQLKTVNITEKLFIVVAEFLEGFGELAPGTAGKSNGWTGVQPGRESTGSGHVEFGGFVGVKVGRDAMFISV